jgi:aminoacyl tRNA synthase complex-interacting multifunctional protein 1
MQAGTKVYVDGFEGGQPEAVLAPKKKIFESVQPGFTTSSDLTVSWGKVEDGKTTQHGLFARVDGIAVACKVPSIVGATVR